MRFRALILGATGYGGGELLRYLAGHPGLEAVRGVSRRPGLQFGDTHPHLRGILDQPFDSEADWDWLAESEHPVLFAAMPHGEFAGIYSALMREWEARRMADHLTVIDLSADFRLPDPAVYFAEYGTDHPCPEHLGSFVYGLTEFRRSQLVGARRIANPGCFATAIQLGLLPLRDLDYRGPLFVSAATGSSGSGATASETTHHPSRAYDLRAYKVLRHQHQTEMACHAGAGLPVEFVPLSAPMVRGIFAVLQLGPVTGLASALENRYGPERFVRLVKGTPRVAAVAGSNFVEMTMVQSTTQAAILVALDNLGKGMAGQAIQNLNIALGFSETDGLLVASPYP